MSRAALSTLRQCARNQTFSGERAKLESQVDPTDKASTEDLRVALRRYRSFFERLLSL